MSAMNEKDYYAILGVSKDADKKTIQKAFQQKARKLHPDVNKAPDAEERFKEVSEAYAVLSDEQKRARYDAMRAGNPYAAGPAPSSPYGGGYAGGYGDGFPFGGAGFPFGAGFTQQRRRGSAFNPEAGSDVVVDIDLNRDQSREGARRGVKYRRYEPCGHCHGSGSVAAEHSRTCPTCGGRGHIDVDMSFLFGGVAQMQCPECGGTGRLVADPCPDCGGTGRRSVMAEAVVEFPAGTHDGDVVRLAGRGHAGTNGGSTGDLVARARITAERLEGRAKTGFNLIGLVLPFLVLLAFTGVLSVFMIACLALVAAGAAMVVSGGVIGRSAVWWRRGLRQMLNGAGNGLMYALVALWFMSCSQTMYRPHGFM